MTRIASMMMLGAAAVAVLAGCASGGASSGWTTVVDGAKGMENFTQVGEANWSATDGVIQASAGGKTPSYLVTKASYKDFMMRVEFWASDNANSGVFLRCQNPGTITDENCYEVNIFDQRPDPIYATGAVVKVAKYKGEMIKAGGQWNTYEITARGSRLVVVLNGQTTVDVEDGKFAGGPFALQWGQGVIKFRKVDIRPL